jgi:hypothetical protein
MATSTIVQPSTARSLKVGGIVSGPTINVSQYGETDGAQLFGYTHESANSGGWFETLGSGGGGNGVVVNRHYTTISSFVAGRAFRQWAVVQSRVAPFRAYVKTSAGTQTLTADPSTDGANWALLTTTSGPALFNDSELVDCAVVLSGDAPARIEWLDDAVGACASLVGRGASGTPARPVLSCVGPVTCSGLSFADPERTAPNLTSGTATLAAGTTGAIANTAVDAGSTILVQRVSASAATDGALSSQAGAGTFTITSNNAGDVSSVRWFVLDPAN